MPAPERPHAGRCRKGFGEEMIPKILRHRHVHCNVNKWNNRALQQLTGPKRQGWNQFGGGTNHHSRVTGLPTRTSHVSSNLHAVSQLNVPETNERFSADICLRSIQTFGYIIKHVLFSLKYPHVFASTEQEHSLPSS